MKVLGEDVLVAVADIMSTVMKMVQDINKQNRSDNYITSIFI